jgi:hypothetical protein
MNKRKRVIAFSIIGLIIVLLLVLSLTVWIRVNNYIESQKPLISDDISESESTLLQDEFDISLPPEAGITAFSYTKDTIIIRIEGVEDLPDFLVDSLRLGIDIEKAKELSDHFYQVSKNDTSPYPDMYGNDRQSWVIAPYEYPSCPFDSNTIIAVFLLDDKLTIEITKHYYSSKNQVVLRDIAVK